MKLIFEEGELERLQENYKLLKDNKEPFFFDNLDKNHIYSIDFIVQDDCIANAIIAKIISKSINIGIDIVSVNKYRNISPEELKYAIDESIDKVYNKRQE